MIRGALLSVLVLFAAGCGGVGGAPGANGKESIADPGGATRSPGEVITNGVGMKLVLVPPGEFEMGSPLTEAKRSGDERTHTVRISRPFYMGVVEVTREEYLAVMGTDPSGHTDGDRLPVHNVSWEDAVMFCRRLSERPDEQAAGREYRLPTEAEWEYACRAGTTTATHFGGSLTSAEANFDGNYPYESDETGEFPMKPRDVGSYAANDFGLYDMHGNVWEWCSDWYAADAYGDEPATDPTGPETGISHVIRGGSWYNFGYACRSAYRSEYAPPLEANVYGFRVVASLGSDELDPAAAPLAPPKGSMPAPPPSDADTPPAMADASDADDDDSTATAAAPTTGGNGTSSLPLLLLIPLLLVVLGLVDTRSPWSWRNADVLLLALVVLAGLVVSTSPGAAPAVVTTVAGLVGLRFVEALRAGRLPVPVAADTGVALPASLWVVGLAIRVPLTLAVLSGTAAWMALACDLLTGVGLIALGRRRHDWRFGLGLAVVATLLPIGAARPAGVVLLFALALLNRAVTSGVLLGVASALYWPLAFAVPSWVAYLRGKGRRRFLWGAGSGLLAGTIGVVAFLLATGAEWAIPWTRVLLTGAFLAGLSALLWFRPVAKSETTVVLGTLLVLAVAVIGVPAGPSLGVLGPWLVYALLGGADLRSRVTPTRGVFAEGLRLPWRRRITADAES